MNNNNVKNKIKLFLVDDDVDFLKLLKIQLLQQHDIIIETFSTGELCIENLSSDPDIIIVDYNLNSVEKNAMNGIQTLDKIKAMKEDIPVIMLSAQDEIDIAITCMCHKAFDYVVKSATDFPRLKKVIIPFLISDLSTKNYDE